MEDLSRSLRRLLKESHPHDIHITKEAPNYSGRSVTLPRVPHSTGVSVLGRHPFLADASGRRPVLYALQRTGYGFFLWGEKVKEKLREFPNFF